MCPLCMYVSLSFSLQEALRSESARFGVAVESHGITTKNNPADVSLVVTYCHPAVSDLWGSNPHSLLLTQSIRSRSGHTVLMDATIRIRNHHLLRAGSSLNHD
jgi:hypothetical protein